MALGSAGFPIAGQSTHLTLLERSSLAATIDPVAAVAAGTWGSVLLVPSGGERLTGASTSIEQRSFSSVTTVLATGRFHLGPWCQISIGQTAVDDLFDADLVAEFPDLAQLKATSGYIGLDGAFPTAVGWLSLGGRFERDEFIGEIESRFVVRFSAHRRIASALNLAVSHERGVGFGRSSVGRSVFGLSRTAQLRSLGVTIGAGASFGDPWKSGEAHRLFSGFARLELRETFSVAGSLGAEFVGVGPQGWSGYFTIGVGLTVGSLAGHVRAGGPGSREAQPMAAAVTWSASYRPPARQ